MWSQLCGDPKFFKFNTKLFLIKAILSAIILTSYNQSLLSSGELKIVSAILAPWRGGLDQIGLATIFNYELAASTVFTLSNKKLKHPILYPYNPIFLAND